MTSRTGSDQTLVGGERPLQIVVAPFKTAHFQSNAVDDGST
jgi:hypothetical protein